MSSDDAGKRTPTSSPSSDAEGFIEIGRKGKPKRTGAASTPAGAPAAAAGAAASVPGLADGAAADEVASGSTNGAAG